MDYVLGVDLGTSYFKLGLFDRQGELCGLGRIHVPKDTHDGSRCEVPPKRFWSLLQEGLRQACEQADARPQQIRALSYASQANSFLLLDQSFTPLTPIILWADDRAQDLEGVASLFERKDFLQTTGMGIPCSHQFCVSKLLWLQRYQPDLYARASRVMTLSDYFTWALSGETAGDAGTASLLGLLDQQSLSWKPQVMDPGHLRFSTPLRPGTLVGSITAVGGARLGLRPGTPLVAGSLDHHMAALGAGVGQIADMSESTGTVLACTRFARGYAPRPNICTGTGLRAEEPYQLAFDDNGGGALQDYQQRFAPEQTIADLESLARQVPIGCEGLLARANAHRYPDREGYVNRTDRHHHGHYTRALFECTAASLVQLVNHLAGDDRPDRIVATGGGARSDLWLQIKADLLGIEWVTTRALVPACLGAALLASVAAGWFGDHQTAAAGWIRIKQTFSPDEGRHHRYQDWYRKRKNSTINR